MSLPLESYKTATLGKRNSNQQFSMTNISNKRSPAVKIGNDSIDDKQFNNEKFSTFGVTGITGITCSEKLTDRTPLKHQETSILNSNTRIGYNSSMCRATSYGQINPHKESQDKKSSIHFDELFHNLFEDGLIVRSPNRRFSQLKHQKTRTGEYYQISINCLSEFKKFMKTQLSVTIEQRISTDNDIFRLRFVIKPQIESLMFTIIVQTDSLSTSVNKQTGVSDFLNEIELFK